MTTHSDGALFLQITRGRTNNPKRPIHGDRFLIGSGEWCDLRLGGTMPVLHSVVRVDGPAVWLEAVVDAPPLHVNGRSVGSCELQDGDQLQIGPFSLAFCDERTVQHKSLMQPIDIEEMLALDTPDVDLSELTATELVDLMERDEELAREFYKRQEQGAAALLDRIRQEVAAESAQSSPESQSLDVLHELQSAIHSLNELAGELQQHSMEMSGEEFSQASSSVMNFQQDIVGRLDKVLNHIHRLDGDDASQRDAA